MMYYVGRGGVHKPRPPHILPPHNSNSLSLFAQNLLFWLLASGVTLTVGTVALWYAFATYYYWDPAMNKGTPASVRDYPASSECTITIAMGTRCLEDIPTTWPTFSDMADRWPWAVVAVTGVGVTNLFLSIVICDIWLQKDVMLGLSWASYMLFWGVISTSRYDDSDAIRTTHYVLAGGVFVCTCLYCVIGAFRYTQGDEIYLYAPLGVLICTAITTLFVGYQVMTLGYQVSQCPDLSSAISKHLTSLHRAGGWWRRKL